MSELKITGHDFKKLILFDGVCNLCNWLVNFIIERDKKKLFKFSPIQSDFATAILKNKFDSSKGFDSVIYLRADKVLTRSSAALTILRDLGGVWKIMAVFFILPKFIRDPLYDLVSKNRFRLFGRKDSCMVPTKELTDRFILTQP